MSKYEDISSGCFGFRNFGRDIKMLDETDLGILDILKENARTSYQDIAKKMNVSEGTVRNRVKDLEEKKVIKKYSAVVDPSKLGYGSVALIGIDVSSDKFLSVAKKLTEIENVKFVSTSTGDHMIMIEVWMENSNKLRDFITSNIESLDGVTRTCPAILMERMKES